MPSARSATARAATRARADPAATAMSTGARAVAAPSASFGEVPLGLTCRSGRRAWRVDEQRTVGAVSAGCPGPPSTSSRCTHAAASRPCTEQTDERRGVRGRNRRSDPAGPAEGVGHTERMTQKHPLTPQHTPARRTAERTPCRYNGPVRHAHRRNRTGHSTEGGCKWAGGQCGGSSRRSRSGYPAAQTQVSHDPHAVPRRCVLPHECGPREHMNSDRIGTEGWTKATPRHTNSAQGGSTT